MKQQKTVKEVFEAWGRDYHADGMEAEHWPRARAIYELIEPSDGNYLEIGVGNGYGLAHMATHQFVRGHCWGMDISSTMTSLARERTRSLGNVTVETGDFFTWNFDGVQFDVIFSMEVFYYLPDMQTGLDKAFSILKPGGVLWVAVNYYQENTDSADWPDRLGAPMQRWSAAAYRAGFEQAGFSDVGQHMIDTPIPTDSGHGDAPTLCTVGRRPR